MRKRIMAIAAAVALGTAAMTTGAMAAGHGGHGGHGGHFGGGGGGFHRGGGFGGGFGGGLGGLYAFGGPAYYGGSCYERRLVPTPYGYRYRLVNVCGY
jgi:hypothetical protein